MTLEELYDIVASDESYRIERTVSTGNMDKFQEAICAFAVKVKKCMGQVSKATKPDAGPSVTGYQSGTSQKGDGYQSGTSRAIAAHRPFGPNVLTLQERILEFCEEPKTLREIADFLGASNKKKVKAKYIDSILGTQIVMTIPDKPNSRLQKYVTIRKISTSDVNEKD